MSIHRAPLCVIAAGILSLAACARVTLPAREHFPLPADVDIVNVSGSAGATFIATNAGEPTSFNPLVLQDATSAEIAGYMLAGLVDMDWVTQEVIPGLAKSWEISADKLAYTFHLRRGVKWSDGAPFTADDVIFTFDCIFDPRYPNRNSQQFTINEQPLRYEKVDDYTVRFTTPDLYAPFLNDIGVAILPKHCLEAAYRDGSLQKQWTVATGINNPSSMAGTGPFKILSYRPGDRLLMVPNPHYWRADADGQRLPYIDLYVAKFVKDNNAVLVNFCTGQTEASSIPPTDLGWVERAAQTYHFSIDPQGPATSIGFIWFNQHPGQNKKGEPFLPPYKLRWFQDARFRQAVSYGFNRQGIVSGVYFGRATELHSIISEGNLKWYNPDVPRFEYAPAKAAALLAEMGLRKDADGALRDTDGHAVEFEVLVPSSSVTAPQIMTSFKEDLRALGIGVKISYIDFGTMLARADAFDYEAGIMGFTGGGDPSGGKAIYKSNGPMHLWYPGQPQPATPWEARIDELMDLQERTFDPKERKALVDEMQDIFAVQRPLIFLVTQNTYLGLKNKWRNTKRDLNGYLVFKLEEIWADEPAARDDGGKKISTTKTPRHKGYF
ncbi:MAG: ABC transporter substrate-binding protein [Verrucomicrobiales bacterium]|jgi:peptide/nickel transport system substrate-binding protein|nr:ABC transporter substrate-binding protein [Verrucomicrobiales bacterium]